MYVDPLGKDRSYFADFLVEGSKLVECKPRRLWNTPSVLAKKKAAEDFCSQRGWTYHLVDPVLLPSDQLVTMYELGQIKFLDRYDQFFREKWLK